MAENDQLQQTGQMAALAGLLHAIGHLAVLADPAENADAARADFIAKYVPQQWAEKLVVDSDKLVKKAAELASGSGTDNSRRLRSIFCRIGVEDNDRKRFYFAPGEQWLMPNELKLERATLFPATTPEGDLTIKYQELWQALETAAGSLKAAHQDNGNLLVYLESLLLLLQRLTWSVPSGRAPDISLYDHSRMTAALATAMTRQSITPEQLNADLPVALLVGGDFSGVQDFIYTITARGATPALRGRSFYLQLLAEAVLRYLLDKLGLPASSVIYVGGGNFYLLAAPSDEAKLRELHQYISRVLLTHHQGDIYLALGHVPVTVGNLAPGEMSKRWDAVNAVFQQRKLRRFSELGAAGLNRLFAVPDKGGNSDNLCSVCDREMRGTQADPDSADPDRPRRVCPQCQSYEDLGDELRKARYLRWLTINKAQGDERPGDYKAVLRDFGWRVTPLSNYDNPQRQLQGREIVVKLDDDANAPLAQPAAWRTIGRKLLVNVTPIVCAKDLQDSRLQRLSADELAELKVDRSIKTYAVLANQSKGITRLGVLRMDVDGLGEMFKSGLGDGARLSHIAGLSMAISLYFEGWVARLAEQIDGDRLYSIYSGGDDLFFVGAWDAVVALAQAIRRDLTSYVADHPRITVSGGLALVTAKYPLYQAARDAGAAEEAAKAFKRPDGQEKDAITFLGVPLDWQRFGWDAANSAEILQDTTSLATFLAADKKRKPLIDRLLMLYEQYEEATRKRRAEGKDQTKAGQSQSLFGRWNYLAAYLLTRMAEQEKGDKSQIDEVKKALADDFAKIEWIGVAARWADLLGRTPITEDAND